MISKQTTKKKQLKIQYLTSDMGELSIAPWQYPQKQSCFSVLTWHNFSSEHSSLQASCKNKELEKKKNSLAHTNSHTTKFKLAWGDKYTSLKKQSICIKSQVESQSTTHSLTTSIKMNDLNNFTLPTQTKERYKKKKKKKNLGSSHNNYTTNIKPTKVIVSLSYRLDHYCPLRKDNWIDSVKLWGNLVFSKLGVLLDLRQGASQSFLKTVLIYFTVFKKKKKHSSYDYKSICVPFAHTLMHKQIGNKTRWKQIDPISI